MSIQQLRFLLLAVLLPCWSNGVLGQDLSTDVVKAFTDAFREAGLKIGLYYSILDYHHGVENGSVTREEFNRAQKSLPRTGLHAKNGHRQALAASAREGSTRASRQKVAATSSPIDEGLLRLSSGARLNEGWLSHTLPTENTVN